MRHHRWCALHSLACSLAIIVALHLVVDAITVSVGRPVRCAVHQAIIVWQPHSPNVVVVAVAVSKADASQCREPATLTSAIIVVTLPAALTRHGVDANFSSLISR